MEQHLASLFEKGAQRVWLQHKSQYWCVTRVRPELEVWQPSGAALMRSGCNWDAPFKESELQTCLRPSAVQSLPVQCEVCSEESVPLQLRKQVTRNGTVRVRNDEAISFGDGGHEVLTFPVYTAANVLREEHRVSLLQALIAEGARRKDFQSSIVEDIIDPNLCPFRLWHARNNALKAHLKLLQEKWAAQNPDKKWEDYFQPEYWDGLSHDARWDLMWDLKRACPPAAFMLERRYEDFEVPPFPEAVAIRETYNWIPVDVQVDANGKCKFLGHISMFPRTPQTEAAYEGFERVLEQMIPAFRILNCAPEKEGVMQVVVKAQRYHLDEPNQCYKGHWHKEGCDTDRIVATGVYYVDIGPDLIGGAVKFRAPGEPPDEHYQEYIDDAQVDLSVPAHQNGILVFPNSMPHRLRLMGNKGTDSQSRTFINFFVVDPARPLQSSGMFMTERGLSAFLSLCVRKSTGKTIPKDLLGMICRHLNLWSDMKEAKSFRAKAREAMKATRSGPGFMYMHYGNCGVQRFVTNVDAEVGYISFDSKQIHLPTSSATPSNGEVEDEYNDEE